MTRTNYKARWAAAYVMVRRFIRNIRKGLLVLIPQTDQSPAKVTAADKIGTAAVTKLAVGRKEAAYLLSLSQRTFDRTVAMGEIHPSGVGRRKIFAISELQRFLKETADTIDL